MLSYCRKVAYSHPKLLNIALRFNRDQQREHRSSEFWDSELSGSKKFYLSGTLLIRCNNMIVAQLISYGRTEPLSILDVGCGPGELLAVLPDSAVDSYTGIDISQVAVEYAINRFNGDIERVSRTRFMQSDLSTFSPEAGGFDAIVFNEVLYLLSAEGAVRQVHRYYKWLRPAGRLCVNMKDDPKSRFIYRMLLKDFRVTASFLGQCSSSGLVPYRIESSPKSFPILATVLQKKG